MIATATETPAIFNWELNTRDNRPSGCATGLFEDYSTVYAPKHFLVQHMGAYVVADAGSWFVWATHWSSLRGEPLCLETLDFRIEGPFDSPHAATETAESLVAREASAHFPRRALLQLLKGGTEYLNAKTEHVALTYATTDGPLDWCAGLEAHEALAVALRVTRESYLMSLLLYETGHDYDSLLHFLRSTDAGAPLSAEKPNSEKK